MKKLLILAAVIALVACNKEEKPKDFVSLSGKIVNKNSDSITVNSNDYHKAIKLNQDGTFKDTLKVKPGIYYLFDGNESTPMYLKNGYDINLNLDAKAFDETIKYEGQGSENSNFLAANNLLMEKLFDKDFSTLDENQLNTEFDTIKSKLEEFIKSHTEIEPTLASEMQENIAPMLKGQKSYFMQLLALKRDLPKGAPSPTFEDYENYKGGTTSLKDLKGKYVYVDVWATWCGPCKAEIPHLKQIEKDYHGKNIAFVSISIDDDRSHKGSWEKAKEDWRAMVNEKELGGMQLFAPEGWKSKFVTDYRINGIPRFILIDPKGNIVTPDAPRPSSTELRTMFDSLL
jgi:thiol-disulfide isomerase/thioredoxin